MEMHIQAINSCRIIVKIILLYCNFKEINADQYSVILVPLALHCVWLSSYPFICILH